MACPFFDQSCASCRCNAFAQPIVPSLHEREIFCRKSWEFARCPWYRVRRALQRPISEQEYWNVLLEAG